MIAQRSKLAAFCSSWILLDMGSLEDAVRPGISCAAHATLLLPRRGPRRRPGRARDLRRAEQHRERLSARGLRRAAAAYVPDTFVYEGPGPGWVPGARGRRGRRAVRPLHPGRAARRGALPAPQRPFASSEGQSRMNGGGTLVAWAPRLPRQLRAMHTPLSLFIFSTMEAAPPGMSARAGDPLPTPPP